MSQPLTPPHAPWTGPSTCVVRRWRPRPVWVAVVLVVATALPTRTQPFEPPTQVADVNNDPVAEGVYAEWAALLDGEVLMAVVHPEYGAELWITSGTEGSTSLLKDIEPGPVGSLYEPPAVFDGQLYFAADTAQYGRELFRSDGTAGGTELIVDFVPGSEGLNPRGLVAHGGFLYFTCSTPSTGSEFCVYDGTSITVIDIDSGPSSSSPSSLTPVGANAICYSANHPSWGSELWCSYGTGALTTIAANVNSGTASSSPRELVDLGDNEVLFTASTTSDGRELVRANIVSSSFTVIDVNTGSASSTPGSLVRMKEKVFFHATSAAEGREAHVYDIDTETVTPLPTEPGTSSGTSSGRFTVAPDLSGTYFSATGNSNGQELWFTDGTPGGTDQVLDLESGAGSSSPTALHFSGSELFFQATTSDEGSELFSYNHETEDLKVYETISGPMNSSPSLLYVDDDFVLFNARLEDVENTSTLSLRESFRGNVSPLIEPVDRSPSMESRTHINSAFGGVIFEAFTPTHGYEPWLHVDGNTSIVANLAAGDEHSWPRDFEFSGAPANTVAFAATDATAGEELHLWDGAGAVRMLDLLPGPDSSELVDLTWLGSNLLAFGLSTTFEETVYAVDTTTDAHQDLALNDAWLCGASEGVALIASDESIALTDGTALGTEILGTFSDTVTVCAILRPPSHPQGLLGIALTWDGRAYTTNGTVAGTVELAMPSPLPGNPLPPAAVQGEVLLFALQTGPNNYFDLYRTDGTVAGTQLVVDRNEANRSNRTLTSTRILAIDGGWLYRDETSATGRDVWFTDGINAPVEIDVASGPVDSNPDFVGLLDGRGVFIAYTPAGGEEFWHSDGTVLGTVPLPEVIPGPGWEDLSRHSATVADDRLYFAASGPGGDGEELWVCCGLTLFADGFESGDTTEWQ